MGMKILIVDDEKDGLASMAGQLKEEYDVLWAGPQDPVPKAIEIWSGNPDLRLAIVDLRMPSAYGNIKSEDVGFRLIADLKRMRPGGRVAVRSAMETHENLARAIKVGADAFIGKNWKPPDFQANVHFMKQCITSGPVAQVLSRSVESRDPYTAGHRYRVGEYCRAIVIHLSEAEPSSFDLAACLAAAELHEVGKHDMPDEFLLDPGGGLKWKDRKVQDRHVSSAQFVGGLAPGFGKVAEIVKQYPRCYGEPSVPWLPDYPDDPDLRGHRIRLEARVLHVANALDTWAADRFDRPGLDFESIRLAVQDAQIANSFDPRVSAAAMYLMDNDRDRFDRIFEQGKLHRTAGLRLQFHERLLTAGRLQNLLSAVSAVHLLDGRMVDRLAIHRVETDESADAITQITLVGLPEDVDGAHEVFKRRIEQAEQQGEPTEDISPELARIFRRGRGTVPIRVEKCDLEDDRAAVWTD